MLLLQTEHLAKSGKHLLFAVSDEMMIYLCCRLSHIAGSNKEAETGRAKNFLDINMLVSIVSRD